MGIDLTWLDIPERSNGRLRLHGAIWACRIRHPLNAGLSSSSTFRRFVTHQSYFVFWSEQIELTLFDDHAPLPLIEQDRQRSAAVR